MSEQQHLTGASGAPQPGGGPHPQQRPIALARALFQLAVTALLVALAFSAGWFSNAGVDQDHEIPASMQPYLTEMTSAWQLVDDRYVDPSAINHQRMAHAGMSDIVDSLGDTGHSRFDTPEEIQRELDAFRNIPTTFGIGVQLQGGGSKPASIYVVLPGSPAADGHLMADDEIIAVGGKDVTGLTLEQIRPLIIGAKDTSVTVTIRRPGIAAPFDVTLKREPIVEPLVTSYLIPGSSLAFIQLTAFDESTSDPTDTADAKLASALKQAKDQGATGIILDLRDNGGGSLAQAVAVASEFLPAGDTVYLNRTRTSRTPVAAESGHQLAVGLPLVILVNGFTASASEIVTAAIAYNRPEVHVVGEHTFGTDTTLTFIPLADGSVILLGTAGWLTPAGANIQKTGVIPDQVVVLPDGAELITPLRADETYRTSDQLRSSQDTQLQQAIKDLTH